MNSEPINSAEVVLNDLVGEKMIDAMVPGYQAEFDADEAELVGAFEEDALTEAEALDSVHDRELEVDA